MANNDKWENETDNFLVEAICGEDEHDSEQAMNALVNRHRSNLFKYCMGKVSSNDAEEAVQETLMAFLDTAKVGKIKEIKNVEAYLLRVANNKCVDIHRKNYAEKKFETNQVSPEISESEFHKNPEEVVIQREVESFPPDVKALYLYEFLTKKLTGCPRTVSILRGYLGLKSDPVARLLGKSTHAVEQCFYRAKKIEQAYKYNGQAELDLEKILLMKQRPFSGTLTTIPYHLEQTMHPVTSHLTKDELKLIGLTPEDLKHYITSVILPIPGSDSSFLGTSSDLHFTSSDLYLLFTRKDWTTMHTDDVGSDELLNRSKGVEFLFRVKIDSKHIVLEPVTPIEFQPRRDQGKKPLDSVFTSLLQQSSHRNKKIITVDPQIHPFVTAQLRPKSHPGILEFLKNEGFTNYEIFHRWKTDIEYYRDGDEWNCTKMTHDTRHTDIRSWKEQCTNPNCLCHEIWNHNTMTLEEMSDLTPSFSRRQRAHLDR